MTEGTEILIGSLIGSFMYSIFRILFILKDILTELKKLNQNKLTHAT